MTGSPMAEVLTDNLEAIKVSDVHARLGLEKGKYILLSAHREENIDTEKNFSSLFTAINKMAEKYDMPIVRFIMISFLFLKTLVNNGHYRIVLI